MKPTLSVVTLTWNSSKFIVPMVETLLQDAAQSGLSLELIVVDNGSADDTLMLVGDLKKQHPEINLLALDRNFGTTRPRNMGIRASRGEYILILDSDTEVRPGTLRGLLESVHQLPDSRNIGIVCPRLVYPDGGFQESARRFPTVQTKIYRLFGLEDLRARDESLESVLAQRTTTVDYAIAAAWFVPRATFDRIGYLDERIFYAPEDVEFCARAWKHGLSVWYYPAVTVVHNCQRLTNKKPISKLGLSHAKDLVRYWWEYRAFFTRPNAVTHVETSREVKQAAE